MFVKAVNDHSSCISYRNFPLCIYYMPTFTSFRNSKIDRKEIEEIVSQKTTCRQCKIVIEKLLDFKEILCESE